MQKIYHSKRNGRAAALIALTPTGAILEYLDTKETIDVSESTMTRWWKLESSAPTVSRVEVVETPDLEPKVPDSYELLGYKTKLEELAEKYGLTIHFGKFKNFGAIKQNGRSLCAFYFSKKSFQLWLRLEARPDHKGKMNHNHTFPVRIEYHKFVSILAAEFESFITASLKYLEDHPRKKGK